MRAINSYINNQEGVAATEFALLAPILMILMLGIFDYGMFMNAQMKLESTARAAAQYVVLGGDPELIEEEIILQSSLNVSADTMDSLDIDKSYTYECADGIDIGEGSECDDGDYLREFFEITISMDYEPIFGFPGVPDEITIAGNVRLQNQ
ncbi:MAG: TadE family protein [Pseudomonadota bacterium]|nr:TadE family protein [Pseudomonadota bacterium]